MPGMSVNAMLRERDRLDKEIREAEETARKGKIKKDLLNKMIALEGDDELAAAEQRMVDKSNGKGRRSKYDLDSLLDDDGVYQCPHNDGREFDTAQGIATHLTRAHEGKVPK